MDLTIILFTSPSQCQYLFTKVMIGLEQVVMNGWAQNSEQLRSANETNKGHRVMFAWIDGCYMMLYRGLSSTIIVCTIILFRCISLSCCVMVAMDCLVYKSMPRYHIHKAHTIWTYMLVSIFTHLYVIRLPIVSQWNSLIKQVWWLRVDCSIMLLEIRVTLMCRLSPC